MDTAGFEPATSPLAVEVTLFYTIFSDKQTNRVTYALYLTELSAHYRFQGE